MYCMMQGLQCIPKDIARLVVQWGPTTRRRQQLGNGSQPISLSSVTLMGGVPRAPTPGLPSVMQGTDFYKPQAHHFIIVAACDNDIYAQLLEEFCLAKFTFDMESLGQRLWCDWDEAMG
ncbi:hypothetical protein NDU88_004501 [Pleurodeles waltl]|uniref:Receptor activity-modifying protein 1 n=1 Tax=Pleurodeles waltl TaxID=8319 RepID=A0AAV7UGP4_PLEWA|nr:hypothetical protein NDU88_004501 [Pleurodeles waltl]